MNQQEQTENNLPQEDTAPITQDYSEENQSNEIVYIAELNGEFFTVDYNSQEEEPMVTPLKIVEFMNPTEHQNTDSQELLSVSDSNLLEKLGSRQPEAPLTSMADSSKNELTTKSKEQSPAIQTHNPPSVTPSISKPKKFKFSENKGLIAGVGLGLLIAWGGTKFLVSRSATESVDNSTLTATQTAQSRSVTVAPVETSVVNRNIEVSGTVEPLELIPITSEVSGLQIQEIFFDEGAEVEKGQILAELNSDTLEAEYIQARAAVDGAQARLAELQAGTRNEEIARAQERVNRATAAVEQAQSDLELVTKRVKRNSLLKAEGAISQDRLDEINNQEQISRANLAQAEASLQEAEQELQQLKTGARPEVISQAQADLAKAQGQLQYASVQLENTSIEAVTDGIIAERNARVGNLTSPSETLFTIIENGSLELRLQVPETDLSRVKPGQSVRIDNQSNGEPIIGKVREIDPIVDSESRQAIVKVNLPSDTGLQPGMFLEAAITTAKVEGTTVPIKALLPQTEDNAIAFVVDENNVVSARTVKMGEILADNQIEVLAGLEPSETIVVKGAAYLKDGDRVSIGDL